MGVKIGVSPISWSNDDMPELGRDTTVEQCLQEGRQARVIHIVKVYYY